MRRSDAQSTLVEGSEYTIRNEPEIADRTAAFIEAVRPRRPRRPRRFAIGDRSVDLEAHLITAVGSRVHLTQIECRLLEYLGARLNQTVPGRKLIDVLWEGAPKRGSHSLRSVVKNVRRKLEPDPAQPRYLILDRTVGYRLQAH